MNANIRERIKDIFYKNNGYARAKDINDNNINKIYLNKLLQEEIISKIKRGLYKWNDFEFSNGIVDVSKIIPQGVICLVSALAYYKLTTYTPPEYQVAIHRASKVIIPDYPPIKLFYFSEKYYKTGVKQVDIDSNIINIYSMEKTICDCFRFKKEIGKDILLESLREYSRKRNRNIKELMEIARMSRVKDIVQKYMEAMLYE